MQRETFAIVRPFDSNDSWDAVANPFKVQRKGPDLYSLLCIQADDASGTEFDGVNDKSLADAARSADDGQTRMHGGNLYFMPTFENHPSSCRGAFDKQKLQPGAPVVIYQNFEASASDSIMATVLGGEFGQAVIDRHANPMQTYATIECVHPGADGEAASSVDVIVPGIFRDDWGGTMRAVAADHSSNPVVHGLTAAAAQLHVETTRGQFYRANVDMDRVIAHARFRNVFMTTRLSDAAHELAMLWPAPVSVADIEFSDVISGALLGDAAKRTTVRAIIDGEVSVRISGASVEVLDPTKCCPRGFFSGIFG